MSIRVLMVDDSPLIRAMLRDMLSSEPGIEVVGAASNGFEGLDLAKRLKPDVITMDVEMPGRNGLECLSGIMAECPTPVIMISTLTSKGASATLEALDRGAFDFICKPNNGSIKDFRTVQAELIRKVKAAKSARVGPIAAAPVRPVMRVAATDKIVVIASSTGGPKALVTLWQQLPKDFPAPIAMVQHMPPNFTASLADRLNSMGTVRCREAKPGDRLEPGLALMAPGGQHMRIGDRDQLTFDTEPTIHGVRPAADYLFDTAAKRYGSRVVGVVLTGMGKDGAAGALQIRETGGVVLGESAETCTVYGMPKAALEVGAVQAEYPIHELGAALVAALTRRVARAS